MITVSRTSKTSKIVVSSRHGVTVISNRNPLQSITLFHVIVIVIVIDYIKKNFIYFLYIFIIICCLNLDVIGIIIEYVDKNLNVIDYIKLALKLRNAISDVRYYRFSDKHFKNCLNFLLFLF